MPVPSRLRDLIRNIRSCKTAADERALIQKECADIRNSFREEDNVFRCRNVAKVLYIYMLGYPAHFGQLEALKLIVSSRFTDKRIGYLGAMLLLDEHREVHLLMTNSLKNDMENSSQYVQSLALCTLGNVCSTEMGRDLAGDVEKLIKTASAHIKKKFWLNYMPSSLGYKCFVSHCNAGMVWSFQQAILCACRIVRKVPEMMENFIPLTKSMLADKHHGVLLASVSLVTEMCRKSSEVCVSFKKLVPTLVRILKNLIMAGYSPEHDVNGISDPFLQVRIIRLLRILGQNDTESSETMNDILAQVATNTETSRTVGNAILYETVLTIMDIKSESGLRILAVNILGRFLLNNDKNIRYVALNSLLKTVQTDMNAVQRHRTTVLDCLKDPDPSILKRAMELCFALVNSNNVRGTIRELVGFLSRCPIDFRSDCSSGIFLAAEKFSPNTRWHIDTMLKVLTIAGNYVRDDSVPNLIHLLSATDKMHAYAAQKLYQALLEDSDMSRQPLAQVTSWCLGEYGDELVTGQCSEEEPINVTEQEVLQLLENILQSSLTNPVTKSYAINAVMKLSARFPAYKSASQNIIDTYRDSHNMELQQRAVEYTALFQKHDNLRPGVLERMPQFEKPSIKETTGEEEPDQPTDAGDVITNAAPVAVQAEQQKTNVDLLLDLVDLGAPAFPQTNAPPLMETGNDLSSILNMGNSQMSVPPATVSVNGYAQHNVVDQSSLNDLLGGLGNPADPMANNLAQKSPDGMTVFEKAGLKIDFVIERDPSSTVTTITLSASNQGSDNFNDFVFQAAVPKSFQLQMMPPSGNVVGANCSSIVQQMIKINNPSKVQPRLRMRIAYSCQGQTVQEMGEFSNFPPSTWQ